MQIFNARPAIYGGIYLAAVPIFALLYAHGPGVEINCGEASCGWIQAVYYSTVTITTLGYGDILPRNPTTQALASLQALLGVILIGMFLNAVSHRLASEAQKAEKAKESLRRLVDTIARLRSHDALVELSIARYLMYTFELTVPLAERSKRRREQKSGIRVTKEFAFSDMRDLFRGTLLITDSNSKPVVAYYFEALDDFRTSIHNLVINVDLQRWPLLEKACLDFIATCRALDYREHILEQPRIKIGEKRGDQFAVELILAHTGPVVPLHGNMKNAYIALFLLVRATLEFIDEYRRLLKMIIVKTQKEGLE